MRAHVAVERVTRKREHLTRTSTSPGLSFHRLDSEQSENSLRGARSLDGAVV